MKIRMRNTIQFDEQLEVIDQLYDVEVHEKGDYSYLLFYNEEKEKVLTQRTLQSANGKVVFGGGRGAGLSGGKFLFHAGLIFWPPDLLSLLSSVRDAFRHGRAVDGR